MTKERKVTTALTAAGIGGGSIAVGVVLTIFGLRVIRIGFRTIARGGTK